MSASLGPAHRVGVRARSERKESRELDPSGLHRTPILDQARGTEVWGAMTALTPMGRLGKPEAIAACAPTSRATTRRSSPGSSSSWTAGTAARYGAAAGVRVVGVEPETAACLTASLAAGRPSTVETPGTVMAGLDCAEISKAAWPSLRAGIHGTVTVGDEETRRAMAELARHGLAIGESGAAPLAALRLLSTDPRCRALREAVELGSGSRALLIATEGRTGGA